MNKLCEYVSFQFPKKETYEESKNITEGIIAEDISNFIKIIISRDLKNPVNPFIKHKKILKSLYTLIAQNQC